MLAEALHAGDLASAMRILDAAVAEEEARKKKRLSSSLSARASASADLSNGASDDSASSSSSSFSVRLANVLANRALCHERLGMMRRALKVRDRERGRERKVSERERGRKRTGRGQAIDRWALATTDDDEKTTETPRPFFFFFVSPLLPRGRSRGITLT